MGGELRTQLATVTAERDERSLVAEQLSMALHIRDTQLATITAERDALRVQLAAATKPPSTGVWMPVEKYTELLAERDRLAAILDDMIGELADATGQNRDKIQTAFFDVDTTEVQP